MSDSNFNFYISEMESSILDNLSDLEKGFGRRKWAISEQTGIPIDILTCLLKRLKDSKKIELIQIFNEETLLADGRGYCLEGKMN